MPTDTRTAIVTGGGQGIGKCIAQTLLCSGMNVAIADIDREAGEEAERELKNGEEVRFFPCDVSQEQSVRDMIRAVAERWKRIDVLVNNAGIMVRRPLEELTLDEWCRVLNVNLTGAFLCSKYAVPYLRQSRGAIVNIASTRAFMSEPDTEAYSASKGGLYALTHALAVSLGPDVRVNCISPGWIEAARWKKSAERHSPQLSSADNLQHPAGRVGSPEDVASLVAFLIAPENGFMTGANITIDGGMTRRMIYV